MVIRLQSDLFTTETRNLYSKTKITPGTGKKTSRDDKKGTLGLHLEGITLGRLSNRYSFTLQPVSPIGSGVDVPPDLEEGVMTPVRV